MLLSFAACVKKDGTTDETTGAPSDSGETPIEMVNLADGYTVVISETATNAVKRLSNELVNAIEEKTEVKLNRVSDNTKKNKASTKEILFGVSKREATTTALAALTTTGYSISFSGEKLVVVATNDFMLEKAAAELKNSLLKFEGKSAAIAKNVNTIYDGSADMSALVDENGNFKYQIIYPDANTNGERDLADKLRLDLQKSLGCKVSLIRTDLSIPVDDASFELLLGKTNRPQSQKLYEGMGLSETKAVLDGNKLVVGAGIGSALDDAISTFYSYLSESAKGVYDGKQMLDNGFNLTNTSYEWMENVSMLDAGTYMGVDAMQDGSMVFVWEDVTESDYNAYCTTLKNNGFAEKQTYALGENRYVLLEDNLANAYAYYVPEREMLRLFVEDKAKGTAYPSATQATYTTVDGYQPTMWQVACDWKTAVEWDTSAPEGFKGANAGMCYILRVADGSFVIIDSGMNSKAQAEIIMKHLKEHTPEGQKPVISMWFHSHAHADHTGGLEQITKLYKDQVDVKAFYHNFRSDFALPNQYPNATKYSKLHTGMTFYVADARFDVMYTHEDLYPTPWEDFNETSTVLRLTFGGQRIMFLGDVQDLGGDIMVKTMPKSEMKSDIVQYSHHGWDGPNRNLYDLIEAPTVMWPNAIYSWQEDAEEENIFNRLINTKNATYFYAVNYYIAHEAEYVKTIIVNAEGTGTQEFILPYTPRAERLPDYEAIYEEIKAAEDALKQNPGEE